MTDDRAKQIEAAFTEFRTKEWPHKECPMCSDLPHGFSAGVAWADAHPSDEVMALVRAIKRTKELENMPRLALLRIITPMTKIP